MACRRFTNILAARFLFPGIRRGDRRSITGQHRTTSVTIQWIPSATRFNHHDHSPIFELWYRYSLVGQNCLGNFVWPLVLSFIVKSSNWNVCVSLMGIWCVQIKYISITKVGVDWELFRNSHCKVIWYRTFDDGWRWPSSIHLAPQRLFPVAG